MEFRELKQEDIDAVKDDSISRGVLHKQPEVIDYGYTLEHEGKVLGIGGIRLINLTTAFAWLDLTHYASEHIKTCYRIISEWMEILVKEHGIKRLQCYCEIDFPEAIRTIEHLGFKKEFPKPMKRFVDEKPAFLYVKHYGVSDGKGDKQE